MDRESIINDFRVQSEEIARHSDQIEELHFDAKLKNGTRFSFNFDADEFEHQQEKAKGKREKSARVSVFNAVTDIIGALGSIAMLSYAATSAYDASTIQLVLIVLTYVFFIMFFSESSVFHLFRENHTRTLKVLFQVRHALLTLSLLFMTLAVNAIGAEYTLTYPACFFIAAMSVFLISLDTRQGKKAGVLVHLLYSILIVAVLPYSQVALSLALMVAVSSLVGGIMNPEGSRIVKAARTSGVFLIAALVLFLVCSEHLLIAL